MSLEILIIILILSTSFYNMYLLYINTKYNKILSNNLIHDQNITSTNHPIVTQPNIQLASSKDDIPPLNNISPSLIESSNINIPLNNPNVLSIDESLNITDTILSDKSTTNKSNNLLLDKSLNNMSQVVNNMQKYNNIRYTPGNSDIDLLRMRSYSTDMLISPKKPTIIHKFLIPSNKKITEKNRDKTILNGIKSKLDDSESMVNLVTDRKSLGDIMRKSSTMFDDTLNDSVTNKIKYVVHSQSTNSPPIIHNDNSPIKPITKEKKGSKQLHDIQKFDIKSLSIKKNK